MVTEFRVHLIGSGYESVKFYVCCASTPLKALEYAEELATNDGYVMGVHYQELVIA